MLSSQTFDAYGWRQSTDGNADPYAGFGGQSGYYTDWETGTAASALTLLGLRYYDPAAGRFLTRDPIGYQGGANLYEYCNNGPIGHSDPNGTFDGLPSPGGSIAGGCLASFLVNWWSGGNNPADTDYDHCLAEQDCLGEAGAATGAWALVCVVGGIIASLNPGLGEIFGANASRIEGCLEGLFSAVAHIAAEKACDEKFCKPFKPNVCDLIGSLDDIATGCVDGLLGGLLEEMKGLGTLINEAIEGQVEAALASLGLAIEKSCSASHGG